MWAALPKGLAPNLRRLTAHEVTDHPGTAHPLITLLDCHGGQHGPDLDRRELVPRRPCVVVWCWGHCYSGVCSGNGSEKKIVRYFSIQYCAINSTLHKSILDPKTTYKNSTLTLNTFSYSRSKLYLKCRFEPTPPPHFERQTGYIMVLSKASFLYFS